MSMDSNVWSLYTRDYSCFCYEYCIFENYDECINQKCGYVSEWNLVPLDVTNINDVQDESFDNIPLISIDYDHISGLIKIGTRVFICTCF